MKDTTQWVQATIYGNNSSGFTAMPGGLRWTDGSFSDQYFQGFFWTNTEVGTNVAKYINLYYNQGLALVDQCQENFGFSVRLVHD